MFDRYDKDRSGEIDSKELQDVLQQETCDDWGSVKWTDEEITAMMNAGMNSSRPLCSVDCFVKLLYIHSISIAYPSLHVRSG